MRRLAFLLLLPLFSIAQTPSRPPGYISDSLGYLSPAQLIDLNSHLRNIEQLYGVQVGIVLQNSLPDGVGSIEEYALAIGRNWHVGKEGRGIVYVALLNDRKQRLEIGERIEGQITDVDARILTDAIKAHFRQQHYYEGLNSLIAGILSILSNTTAQQAPQKAATGFPAWIGWTLFGCVLLIIWAVWYYRRRKIQTLDKSYNVDDAMNSTYDPYIHRSQPVNNVYIDNSSNSYSSPSSDSGSSYSSSSDYSSSSSSSDYSSSSSSSDSSSSFDSSSSSSFDGGGSSNDW